MAGEHRRSESFRPVAAECARLSAPDRDTHRRSDRDGIDRTGSHRDPRDASSVSLSRGLALGNRMPNLHVSWDEYNALVERLALSVYESGYRFDQIICLARGGLRVGDVLSRIYEQPLAILSTHSYTAEGGTLRGELVIAEHMTMTKPRLGEKVLLVDDMVDSGHTLAAVHAEL